MSKCSQPLPCEPMSAKFGVILAATIWSNSGSGISSITAAASRRASQPCRTSLPVIWPTAEANASGRTRTLELPLRRYSPVNSEKAHLAQVADLATASGKPIPTWERLARTTVAHNRLQSARHRFGPVVRCSEIAGFEATHAWCQAVATRCRLKTTSEGLIVLPGAHSCAAPRTLKPRLL